MRTVAMGSEPQPRGPGGGRGRPLGGSHDDFLPLGESPAQHLGEVPVADAELKIDGLGLSAGPPHPRPPPPPPPRRPPPPRPAPPPPAPGPAGPRARLLGVPEARPERGRRPERPEGGSAARRWAASGRRASGPPRSSRSPSSPVGA